MTHRRAYLLGIATTLTPALITAAYTLATLRVQTRNWGEQQWANDARERAWQ